MKPFSLLSLAALSLVLSACFKSEVPKFPLSSAVPALGDGGRYEMFEGGEGGKYYLLFNEVEVRPRPDGAYDIVTERDPYPVSFHDIGNGRFVGQAKRDDPPGYGYGIITREGSEVFVYSKNCDFVDVAFLVSQGVDPNTCSIDGAKDSVTLFNAIWDAVWAGQPSFKLVPVH
jgi:hypothetical protein